MRRLALITLLIILIYDLQQQRYLPNDETETRTDNQSEQEEIIVPEDKTQKIKTFLERMDSPMATEAGIFIWVDSRYSLPYSLLPAISMVESGGCKHTLPDTNNCFGWRPYNRQFESIQAAIIFTAEWITTKPAYKAFQATGSIEDLGKVYAESPDWANKVRYWMREIENEEERLRSST